MMRLVSCILVVVVGGMLAGCGSDMPLVPVRGVVTFDGEPPPKAGRVVFSQLAETGIEGLPNRPGRARFGTDGRFEATTFEPGDGLLPGKYKVRIMCRDGMPTPQNPPETISYVPPSYQPPELVIEKDQGPIEVSYDVPPNPKKR